jgi:hypothetical protein
MMHGSPAGRRHARTQKRVTQQTQKPHSTQDSKVLVSLACCCEHRPAYNTALQNEPASANRPLYSVHSIPCMQLMQAADVSFICAALHQQKNTSHCRVDRQAAHNGTHLQHLAPYLLLLLLLCAPARHHRRGKAVRTSGTYAA